MIMDNMSGFKVQQITIEPEHITEEKERINNFIGHYKLFCDEISKESSLEWIPTQSKILLYTVYMDEGRNL